MTAQQINSKALTPDQQGQSRAGQPWHRHPMVWLIIALPLSSVFVAMFYIFWAVNGGDSIVVDNYYKDGKAINQQFEQDQLAVTLAIEAEVLIDQQTGLFTLKIKGYSGPFVQFDLFHNTRSELDRRGALAKITRADPLSPASPSIGYYQYQFNDTLQGTWYLQLSGDDGSVQNRWRLRQKVTLPSANAFVIKPLLG